MTTMYAWNERSAILLKWYIRGRLTSCRMTQDLGSWEILRVAEQLKKAFVTNFLCMTVNQFEYAEFNDASFFPPDRKHNFWINLVQKFKIASFSWNLVPRLIKRYRIQWWWTLSLFFTGNNSFWANVVQKTKIVVLSWNFTSTLNWMGRIQWEWSVFPFSTRDTFLIKFGPKN